MAAPCFAPRITDERQCPPSQTRVLWAILVLSIVYGIAIQWRVWEVGSNGLSTAIGTVPYWDFSNLWGGARLAMMGQLTTLFDPSAYRHGLAQLLAAPVTTGEWSYPPTMLLVGAPLAALPIGTAYVLWTGGTIVLHALAVRGLRLPRAYAAIAIFSPALAWNVALGQNGALTGALLLAGLLQAERRPWLGGALLGCLIVKPHLAVLVPVALVARSNWRAIGAAAFTATALFLLSAAAYGWGAWYGFATHTGPMMRQLMEAPFPQGYQMQSVTVFVFARALGLGVSASYLMQAAAATLAIAVIWRSAQWPLDTLARAAIVVTLTFLATPYSYTYDMVVLAAPLALLLFRRERIDGRIDLLAMTVWFVPCMPVLRNASMMLPLAPILLLALVMRTLITATNARMPGRRASVLGVRCADQPS